MRNEIYLVWAQAGNTRTVLKAFRRESSARDHVERCTRNPHDYSGKALPSAAETLGIQLTIESMSIEEN